MKCTQYCHSGHLDCCNPPSTVVEQTEVFIVSQNNSTCLKQKCEELTLAKSTKKSLISQDEPPPCMQGLRPTINISLFTQAQTAKTLAHYPNTAGIVAKLSSICLCTLNEKDKIPEKNRQIFFQDSETQKNENQVEGNNNKSNSNKKNFNREIEIKKDINGNVDDNDK